MIYGDMLAFFPEQFRMFDYFHISPDVAVSYKTIEKLPPIKGILQYVKKGELRQENDTISNVNVPTLWTRQPLKVGDYFIKKDSETFRVIKPVDWLFEGGFCCYELSSVVGNVGDEQPFDDVNLGQNDYA